MTIVGRLVPKRTRCVGSLTALLLIPSRILPGFYPTATSPALTHNTPLRQYTYTYTFLPRRHIHEVGVGFYPIRELDISTRAPLPTEPAELTPTPRLAPSTTTGKVSALRPPATPPRDLNQHTAVYVLAPQSSCHVQWRRHRRPDDASSCR